MPVEERLFNHGWDYYFLRSGESEWGQKAQATEDEIDWTSFYISLPQGGEIRPSGDGPMELYKRKKSKIDWAGHQDKQ